MLIFAANITMMFAEFDFLDRIEMAAKAGFDYLEFQFPYEFEARDIKNRLDAHGITCILHNLPAGDFANGQRGLACLPDCVLEFRDGVKRAIDYAGVLGVRKLNCLAGIAPKGETRGKIRNTLIENLDFAATQAQKAGIQIMVEACNHYDMPGFLLNRSSDVIKAIRDTGHDNLRLQYDIYHMQREEGELAKTIEILLSDIGHIQIADNPGRHQPGTGEINFVFLFRFLDEIGYQGFVAGEYHPQGPTADSLSWCGL